MSDQLDTLANVLFCIAALVGFCILLFVSAGCLALACWVHDDLWPWLVDRYWWFRWFLWN